MRRFAAPCLVLLLLSLMIGCQAWKDWRSPHLILPGSCQVEQGCLLQFKALKGSKAPTGLRWALSSPAAGKINDTGLFLAGWTPGSYEVRLQDRSGQVLAKSAFKVTGARQMYAVSNFAEIYDPKTGTVRPVGSMARARSGPAAALLADGRVMVIGGRYDPPEDGFEIELFDPSTGTFSLAPWQPIQRRNGGAALELPGGKVALIGGNPYAYLESGPLFTETFEPLKNAFTVGRLDTKVGRTLSGALALKDGSVLLWGRGIEVWEPAYDSAIPIACEPAPGAGSSGCELNDGQVLITGGVTEYGGGAMVPQKTAWLVNPRERTAKVFEMAGAGRYGHFSFASVSSAVLVGGIARQEDQPMMIQDPSGSIIPMAMGHPVPAWTVDFVAPGIASEEPIVGELPVEWGSGVLVKDHTVLFAGGRERPLAEVYLVDAKSDQLTRLPDMLVRRRNASLIRLKDGRILILGGETKY